MSRRLNRYQRRQANRRADRIMWICFFITGALFGIGYLLIRGHLDGLMYQEVLTSNGTMSLADVQWNYWKTYWSQLAIAFFVVWMNITLIVSVITRRRYNTFQFGDAEIHQLGNELQNQALDLFRISPSEFERQVARLITHQTGHTTKVIGGAGDNGVDIKVYNANRELVGVVQCKRTNPSKALPPKYIREMVDVMQTNRVTFAYLATTSYFTEESRRYAAERGIRLIEGRDLEYIVKKVQRTEFKKQKSVLRQDDPNKRFRPPAQTQDYSPSINGMWDEP